MPGTAKRITYQILESGRAPGRLHRLFELLIVALIIANVGAAALETVPKFGARYGEEFNLFERISVIIFTVEYLLRLWVCTEHLPLSHLGPIKARLRFAINPFSLIDLMAILPFYLSLFMPAFDLRVLRVFRLLRLLKLARYSPALATLGRVIADERRALSAALLIMLGLLMAAATAMFYAERFVQPEVFGSIPHALWWAVATLTTVGYGDIVPVSTIGRIVGGVVMIFGLGMFALPIGIIASGFANEIHRRDFVVTWGMVARVPLFSKLDALSVSRITNLLRARVVQPDTVIARPGDPAEFMYFIADGEVEVGLHPDPVRLQEGEFFGEMALLQGQGYRSVAIRAVTRCRLLTLNALDFEELLATDGDLRAAITAVAENRLGGERP